MKSFDEIKQTNGIEIIEDCFQETVRAGVGCSCTVRCNLGTPEKPNIQRVVAAYYIEVDHP